MAVGYVVLLMTILAVLPEQTLQCATNGLCGGGPQCGGYAPPPVQYPCSCQRSYGCGSYGCYRHRARGSNTFVPKRSRARVSTQLDQDRELLRENPSHFGEMEERRHPMSSSEEEIAELSETAASLRRQREPFNPNRAFLECCMDRKLPDACLQKCNFNSYTKDALQRMYFKQDACPLEAMSEMQFCAAMGRDHRECCVRNGITTTLAGAKCLTFCNQKPGRVQKLDMSYVPCFDRFESMKSCFWHDLTTFYRSK